MTGLSRLFAGSRRFNAYNLEYLPEDAVHPVAEGAEGEGTEESTEETLEESTEEATEESTDESGKR